MPKIYVLDTNVVSALALRRPDPRLVEWVANVDGVVGLPVGVIIEIQRGISYLRPDKPKRARELEIWLESLLETDVAVLALTATIARLYADMTCQPALKNLWVPHPGGKPPKLGQDLAIAATAIVHHGVVVTSNVKDFVLIHRFYPLPGLFDPQSGQWPLLARVNPSPAAAGRPDRSFPQSEN